jgi:Ca2+-binding RTX toxin-like protein
MANILGTQGNDRLLGTSNDDVISGGMGRDVLRGGAGSDTFVWSLSDIGSSTDVIRDFNFEQGDRLDFSELFNSVHITTENIGSYIQIQHTSLASIVSVDVTGSGTAFQDVVKLTRLDSQPDLDTLYTQGLYIAESNNTDEQSTETSEELIQPEDSHSDPATIETVEISPGDDVDALLAQWHEGYIKGNTLLGNYADNTFIGGSRTDTLRGRDGNDTMYGVSGNDLLEGGEGDDYLNGGDGIDIAEFMDDIAEFSFEFVDESTIIVTHSGLLGTDTLIDIEILRFNGDYYSRSGLEGTGTPEPQYNEIIGSEYTDRLNGTNENDAIYGLEGRDWIFGNDGDDLIFGGGGSDKLYGGEGADIFSWSSSDLDGSWDKIRDFNSSEGDTLDLSSILSFNEGEDDITDFIRVSEQNSRGTVRVYIDSDGDENGSTFERLAIITGLEGQTNESDLLSSGIITV